MIRILVSVANSASRDIILTALRNFPGVAAFAVPAHELAGLVLGSRDWDAVILDSGSDRGEAFSLVRDVREANGDIEMVAVTDEVEKDSVNRMKLDHDIFTFIALPIDPFDLLKRLHRLIETLMAHRAA